ncbi:MAG: dicarboxylate/amino acid:cation symporter [Waddliaceae bacterium]|nr:dicarboxylate/amino acid:cation symporter [Waddliaceae bacterium]
MQLWLKILIGLALGVVAGPILGAEYSEYIKPIGTIFLSLINMLIVLLVFSSMTVGITAIHDPQKLGRVGLKSLLMYATTTAISILIGLGFAYVMQPGAGVQSFKGVADISMGQVASFSDTILGAFPTNPIQSLATGNVLQIIVFSLFLGLSINFTGEKARPLLEVLESLAEVMYRMTSIVMEFAPIGVFAIMTWVAGTFGLDILKDLAWFLVCNYLACIVHMVVVYGGILLFLAKLNPLHFFNGMGDAMAVAFSTNSSSATLPVSLHCVQQNLGVSKNISSFVLPLGATVNMNGVGIFQGIACMFIAQAYGITLDWQSLVMIVVTATLSAVGAAGIPGTGYVMLTVVLSSVGLPLEGVAVLAGVDRIREMISTVVNILGDAVVSVYVAKTEGELDETQYNHAELVEMEESAT